MAETTKTRVFGQDTDFLAWIRNCEDLPSREGPSRFSIQDVDVMIHCFMKSVDRVGTREVQPMMEIEVKTNGARPDFAQRDTMWCKHRLYEICKADHGLRLGDRALFHLGIFFLFFSATSPLNSDRIYWGRFDESGKIIESEIDIKKLVRLLRFDDDPRTLERSDWRRRHSRKEYAVQTLSELGFPMLLKKVVRS